jgi:hypothetical protein
MPPLSFARALIFKKRSRDPSGCSENSPRSTIRHEADNYLLPYVADLELEMRLIRPIAIVATLVALATPSVTEAKLFKDQNPEKTTSDSRGCIKMEQQQTADGWWTGKFTNDQACPRITIIFSECSRNMGPPPTKYCQNRSSVLKTGREKRIHSYQDKVELLKACAGKVCN